MNDNIYGVSIEHDKWLNIDIATETIFLVGSDLSKYGDDKYNSGVGEDCNIFTLSHTIPIK